MINLLTFQYYRKQNVIFGRCSRCHSVVAKPLKTPFKLTCCGTAEFDKLPLYYLIKNRPEMIVYKLTDFDTDKTFIGVVVTSDTKSPDKKVEEELNYIAKFRTFKIDPSLKELLRTSQLSSVGVKILSTPKSMLQAMIDEKLYISKYNSMVPNGFNQVHIIETLMNWNKK